LNAFLEELNSNPSDFHSACIGEYITSMIKEMLSGGKIEMKEPMMFV
jgi:hypothetical protein